MASGQWNWAALSQPAAANAATDVGGSSSTTNSQPQQQQKRTNKAFLRPAQQQETRNGRPVDKHAKPPNADLGSAKLAKRDGDIEGFSKLRITERTVSAQDLKQEMSDRRFIALQQMDIVARETFTNQAVDWVTIGVLVRKTLSKATTNGSSFMVWALSDLNDTELAVFLFDEAYNSHWKAMEGSIFALLNAPMLPASEKNKFAFKVSKPEEIVALGRAVDFGICKGTTSGEARCRIAINTAQTQYCMHHITSKFMQAGKGRQQLNNALGNFRKGGLFSAQQKNISAGVYTGRSSGPASSGWAAPIAAKKRKRADGASGGILGVPTVVSASGAVVQKIARPPPPQPIRNLSAAMNARPNTATASGNRLAGLAPPKRESRGQKMLASLMPSSGGGGKKQKVNMIRFMNTGSKTS